ncbi:MAG: DUF6515 family protein [Planctomycetota bacterium JB042]
MTTRRPRILGLMAAALLLPLWLAEADPGRGGRGGRSVGSVHGGSVRGHGRSTSSAARRTPSRARPSTRREAPSVPRRSVERPRRSSAPEPRRGSMRHPPVQVPFAGTDARPRTDRPLGRDPVSARAASSGPVAVTPDGRRVGTSKRPFRGGVLDDLPGAAPVSVGGRTYYRYGSYCYRRVFHDGRLRWVGCRPPPGLRVSTLPAGVRHRLWRGRNYWYDDDVWYVEDEGEYEVVEAPEDSAVEDDEAEGEAVEDDRDPFVILRAASALLAARPAFEFEVEDSWDETDDRMTKVKRHGRRSFVVARPDRLRADLSGDRGDRTWVLSGGRLRLVDRKARAWGEVEAGDTVDAALDFAAERLGSTLPLGEFLSSDLYASVVPNLTSGYLFGTETVQGAECHHLAFAGTWCDAQLWVETGSVPLVRQLVLTYKLEPGRPRYTATFEEWRLDTAPSAETFRLDVPASFEEVDVVPTDVDASGAGG